jgi:hypothetical protein
MPSTQLILFLVVAGVMGWFAGGVIWNIRQGNAVLRWMQDGLPRLGERTTLRWLGSSAVQLEIATSKPPFRRVELVLVLEPRDVPWFWLLARLQGRRDLLIVRAQLVTAPALEFDLLAPGSWSERQTTGRGQAGQWTPESLAGVNFCAPTATRPLARQLAPAAWEAALKLQPTVWRLSSRRDYPQLEVHVSLPDPRQANAAQFFGAVRALAEQMGQRISP